MPLDTDLAHALRSFVPDEVQTSKFRYWHVETLVNQAADLIDRCIRDRAELYGLCERQVRLDIELQTDALELNQLNANAEPSRINVDAARTSALINIKKSHNDLYDLAIGQLLKYRNAVSGFQANPIEAERIRMIIGRELNNEDLVYYTNLIQRDNLVIQQKRESRDHAQKIYDIKVKNLQNKDAELNLDRRIRALAQRLKQDYKDAYTRMTVARRGLELIYGYDEEEYENPFPHFNTDNNDAVAETTDGDISITSIGSIDASALWLRAAIRWMVGFGHLDQAWTAVFSIRSLVGEVEWTKAIVADAVEASHTFILPPGLFERHNYSRLRGMSMFCKTGSKSRSTIYNAIATLPKAAVVWHGDRGNDDGAPRSVTLDQQKLPSCFFGRVQELASPRPPEVVGAVSLANASPIQQTGSFWKIVVAAPNSDALTDLQDVILELNMVGRPRI